MNGSWCAKIWHGLLDAKGLLSHPDALLAPAPTLSLREDGPTPLFYQNAQPGSSLML